MELSRSDWADHLEQWRRSGETARRYCDEHGLKLGSLQYWSGRIRRESGEALNETFETPPAKFAKVRRRGTARVKSRPPAPLRVVVGGVQVEVPVEFDAGTLRRVLDVLGSLGGGR